MDRGEGRGRTRKGIRERQKKREPRENVDREIRTEGYKKRNKGEKGRKRNQEIV